MFWNTGRLDITEIHFFFFKRPVTDLFAEQIMTFSDYQVYAEKKKKKKSFSNNSKDFCTLPKILSLESIKVKTSSLNLLGYTTTYRRIRQRQKKKCRPSTTPIISFPSIEGHRKS